VNSAFARAGAGAVCFSGQSSQLSFEVHFLTKVLSSDLVRTSDGKTLVCSRLPSHISSFVEYLGGADRFLNFCDSEANPNTAGAPVCGELIACEVQNDCK
jgi:hypothetical protein